MSYFNDTALLHADDGMEALLTDVSAPIHVTTTFEYPDNPDELKPGLSVDTDDLIYARESHMNAKRCEAVLSKLTGGHAVVYANGMAAFTAAMIHYHPKTVMVGKGYSGVAGVLQMLSRNYGTKIIPLDADPELLQEGDVVHLETPVNPTGLARDIEEFAKIAKSRGAKLVVDATFAPPPLFEPFRWGADLIMHSATKYLAGHSDTLAGVLVTKSPETRLALMEDRLILGSILPSLDSWLLLRSLRTFHMRIKTQLESANKIVRHLNDHIHELPALKEISHASLQNDRFVRRHLPLGGPAVFQITMQDRETAKSLPSKLKLFHHCTSLGGVESMIEWRLMSDSTVPDTVLRVSVGVEDVEDLIKDLVQGISAFTPQG